MSKSKIKNPGFPYKAARRLLGQILVDGNFIRYHELEHGLEEQKKTNTMLGETLVSMGLLDPVDLKAVLSVNEDLASLEDAISLAAGVRRLLGDLLLQAKHIIHEELELALRVQKRTGEKLGKVLIRLGFITEGELDALLKFQENQGVGMQAPGRLSIGELLVSTDQISREQLDEALARQKISKKKIGEILVESGYINHQQLAHGLNLQERLLTSALVAILSLAPFSNIHAVEPSLQDSGSKGTPTKITESIQMHTSLKIVYQKSELNITREDILRGYIDIPLGAHIEIQNNNLAGYLVVFEGLGGPVKEVIVRGLGKDALLNSDGGWIAQPYHGRDPLMIELSYRFRLSEEAKPGIYSWPLKISVSPIIPV